MNIPFDRVGCACLAVTLLLSGCDFPDSGGPPGPPSTDVNLDGSSGAPAPEAPEAPEDGSTSGEHPADPTGAETGAAPDAPSIWGCTHTRGYWQTHHIDGVAENAPWPISEATPLCDRTWVEHLSRPAGGDPWVILAAQWIAASLNVASGADAPPAVEDALARGQVVLEACSVEDEAEALAFADLLDRYNNGLEGVPHCDDVTEATDGGDTGEDTDEGTSGSDGSGGETSEADTEECVIILEGGSSCDGTVFPPVG